MSATLKMHAIIFTSYLIHSLGTIAEKHRCKYFGDMLCWTCGNNYLQMAINATKYPYPPSIITTTTTKGIQADGEEFSFLIYVYKWH